MMRKFLPLALLLLLIVPVSADYANYYRYQYFTATPSTSYTITRADVQTYCTEQGYGNAFWLGVFSTFQNGTTYCNNFSSTASSAYCPMPPQYPSWIAVTYSCTGAGSVTQRYLVNSITPSWTVSNSYPDVNQSFWLYAGNAFPGNYTYNFGDGNVTSTSTRNITHKYTSPGIYTITEKQCYGPSQWGSNTCVEFSNQTINVQTWPPIAAYTNYSCQGTGTYCGLPATLYIDDASINATSIEWNLDHEEFGSMLTSNALKLQWNITYAGRYRLEHIATNPYGNDTQYLYFLATENATTPNVNITGNITPPNFTPVIPTIPETLAPLPSSLNRTNVRTLINSSVFANVSAEYLNYWDNFYDGLKDMFKNILDTLFYPVTTIREYLEIPSEWMLQLASQYAEKSNNLTVYFFRTVYAFPPKLLNLVTYSLVLDFVLVLMHEFGGKK